MKSETHRLALPSPKSALGGESTAYVSSEGPVVIVGANGSGLTAAKVERRLKNCDAKARGKEKLGTALSSLTSSIKVDSIYDETVAEVNRVIEERNYAEALRLYNNKGLLGKIESLFGFARKGMPEVVKRLASEKEGGAVLSALRKQLPEVEI